MDIPMWLEEIIEPESAGAVPNNWSFSPFLVPDGHAIEPLLGERGSRRGPIALDSSIIVPLRQQATVDAETGQNGSIDGTSRRRSTNIESPPSTGKTSDNPYK